MTKPCLNDEKTRMISPIFIFISLLLLFKLIRKHKKRKKALTLYHTSFQHPHRFHKVKGMLPPPRFALLSPYVSVYTHTEVAPKAKHHQHGSCQGHRQHDPEQFITHPKQKHCQGKLHQSKFQ